MAAIGMTYLFIGGFIFLAITLLRSSIRAHGVAVPSWMLILLGGLLWLMFMLVPIDSQAAVVVFRARMP